MQRSVARLALIALLAAPATAWADPPVALGALTDPIGSASSTFSLTWTNVCSSTGVAPFFPTCASAQLTGYDNGWLQLDFWNRAGINSTFANSSTTAIGLGFVPAASGDRPDDWDAGLGGNQIAWSPATGGGGIPGPGPADGFSTSGQGSAFCSNLASTCPGGLTTTWGGSFGAGGGAVFYWFVGNTAISALDPSKITLQLHQQAGPGGISTGYICYSDAYVDQTYSTSWTCGGDTPGGPQETVPEPATMTLLATGLAAMAAADRRRRKQKKS